MKKQNKIITRLVALAAAAGGTIAVINSDNNNVQNEQTFTPQTIHTIAGVGSAKYATRNADGSIGYPAGIVAGDTIYIDGSLGTYTGGYMGNKTFNPAIVIKPLNAQVKLTNGFAFDNMIGWKLDGTGIPGVKYGFKITGPNLNSGVAISVFNLGQFGEVANVEVSHVMSAVWIKDEQKCSLNYPNGFFHYNIHDCYFHNTGLDMLYIGSTDPYGVSRSIVCGGVTMHPRPARVGDIWVHNNFFDSANRQVLQINNCDTLGALVENNTFKHAGFGMEGNQGVLLFYGQGTKNTITRNDTFVSSWQHNLWCYAYGDNQIYNNIFDSSGIVPAGTNYSENPIVISGVPNTEKANFNIHNNTIGIHSSDPDKTNGVWLDNTKGNLALSGNVICSSGTVYNPQKVPYSSTCSDNGDDSVIVVVTVTHDTLKPVHYDTLFGSKDTVIINAVKTKILPQNDGRYRLVVLFDAPVDSTIKYIVRLPYDSVQIVHNGATHDSSYKVPKGTAMTFGLFNMINDTIINVEQKIAQIKEIGTPLARVNMNYGNAYNVDEYIDSGLDVSLTWNFHSVQEDADFTDDSANVYRIIDSMFAANSKRPKRASCENEEGNLSYHTGSAQTYLNELTAFTRACHKYNISASNGGMTNYLIYCLHKDYEDRGLTDSANFIETQTGITNWTNAFALHSIEFGDSILNGIAATGVDNIDVHWYEPFSAGVIADTNALTNLLNPCLDLVMRRTGLKPITTETGIRNRSPAVLTALLNQWKYRYTKYIIYFYANGTLAFVLPEEFKNYIKNI